MGILKDTIKPIPEQRFTLNRLIDLAVQECTRRYDIQPEHTEVLDLIPNEDRADVADCDRDTLQAWACGLALRTAQARGIVPDDWNQVSHCHHCGNIWAEHTLPTLFCGWCWLRVEGKLFPRPGPTKRGNSEVLNPKP